MKSYDYEAVTYDGEVFCVECLPPNLSKVEREGIFPIFADSEWDSYPVCSICGTVHDYVSLTDDRPLGEIPSAGRKLPGVEEAYKIGQAVTKLKGELSIKLDLTLAEARAVRDALHSPTLHKGKHVQRATVKVEDALGV